MTITITDAEGPAGLQVSVQETRATESKDITCSELATQFEVMDALISEGYDIGKPHPTRSGYWCVDIAADHQSGFFWKLTATYSNNPGQSVINRDQNTDPLAEPARISWSGDNYQQVAVVDKDDKPILNSAGDPYDPPLMKDFSRPVATVRKNVSSAPAWILTSHDAVNSDEFVIDGLTCLIGKAKLKRADISEWQWRNGVAFRELTLVIHFSKDGWVRKVVDAGFRRIYSGTNREMITLTAEDGAEQYPVAPVPLDGSGVELTDPTPDTVVYNSHDLDGTIEFSTLPLS